MTSPAAPELVKWYTRARKFPQLIGRTPDGAKIWGGPYTFTQAIGAGVIGLIAVNTMGVWANYGFIGNTLVLVAVTYGGVLLLGRIPVGSRSPISFVTGGVHAVMAPRMGRLGGRPIRPRRPHVVRHRVTVAHAPLPTGPTGPTMALRHRAPSPARATHPPSQPAPPEPTAAKARADGSAAAKHTAKSPAAKPLVAAPKPSLTGIQSLLAQSRTPPTKRN